MGQVTRIDFYILEIAGAEARERFACRLAEKAYDAGHRAFILTEDEAQTERLDTLLWTFRQGSFVPHATSAERDGEPVAIGSESPAPDDEVLINIRDTEPKEWRRWPRVAEIVDQREPVLQASRRRFRGYRDAGVTPHTHRIEARQR